jgi:SOS-response transcriptional repressor LexA
MMNADHSGQGEYLLAQAALPGTAVENIGILLLDSGTDQLHSRFRRDCQEFAGEEADWFETLEDDLVVKSQELGGSKCLEWMESTLSHVLRLSYRSRVAVELYAETTKRLYLEYVHPKVLPFRTHLPVFSLEAAAGKFGKQMHVEPEGWVEVWPQLGLSDDMFVTHLKGHSMEPAIPNGSLCAIRGYQTGSYDGKVALLEYHEKTGGNRYTLQRYGTSANTDPNTEGDADWLHERITLKPLNRKFKSWEIPSAEDVSILGEFLFVV